jgi:Flp pilus assembly protein TadG
LLADRRGAVAFEMPFVVGFLILVLLLPLADVAIAGFQYISAWQALRAFGQSIQYSPPDDVTNASSWASNALANADPSYPISSITLICGDSNAVCTSANLLSPKYYSYQTSITLNPMVLTSILCPGGNCTYTLPYSERFQ